MPWKKGATFVDHTTASAEVARELAAAADIAGFGFIDAPVSGGQAGAENGVLTVMCGGEEKVYAAVEPAIMSFARSCRLLGPSGSGQLAKMVNQVCIAGLVQGLSEAIAFGQKAGLDMKAVLDVISKGAAGSWQMENRGKTMVEDKFDFGFAVDWMRKDLDIVLAEGAPQRRLHARHRAGRPVLCRSPEDGRRALGYVEPDRAPEARLSRRAPRTRRFSGRAAPACPERQGTRLIAPAQWRV